MGFLKEFKEFAMRGNVIDLAVGVVLGGAFGKIVGALVEQVIMPGISLLGGGSVNFADLAIRKATTNPDGSLGEIVLGYGAFLQSILDFILIAFCIFLVVKAINKFKKQEEAPAAPPEPTKEELLLTEIRDLLKGSGKTKTEK